MVPGTAKPEIMRGSRRERCAPIPEKGAGTRGSAKGSGEASRQPSPEVTVHSAGLPKFVAKGQSLSASPGEASSGRPRGYTRANARIKKYIYLDLALATTAPNPNPVKGGNGSRELSECLVPQGSWESLEAQVSEKFPEPWASWDPAAGPQPHSGRGAARRSPVTWFL